MRPPEGAGQAERARAFLTDRGVTAEQIDEAERQGRLHVLVADQLIMPDERCYTLEELAEAAAVPAEQLRRMWRALGFPDIDDEERAFGDADLEAIHTMVGLMALRQTDLESSLQLARVIGQAMARIAEAEINSSPLVAAARSEVDLSAVLSLTADATLPGMARLLEYSWRRHLQAAARQTALTRVTMGAGGRVEEMAVGFADLVGFTVLSQQLNEQELTSMVARFEQLAHEIVVAHGGRVVKMIGDEVFYVSPSTPVAADVALRLSEAYASDEVLSEIRVGLACGAVVRRDGDVYGPVVNMAHRIVNIAKPGSVLVSAEVHDALADDQRFSFSSLRPRYLKDIGRTNLWRLSRPGQEERDSPGPFGARWRPGMLLSPPERLLETVERLIPPVRDRRPPS